MSEITRAKDGAPAVTIYHNPKCSTSRTTLGLIREAGIEPEVIEYLKAPPGRKRLGELMKAAGLSARELIRSKEQTYADLSLGDAAVSDQDLVDAMTDHPILMNRPIVVTAKGIRLCRPADKVRDILP